MSLLDLLPASGREALLAAREAARPADPKLLRALEAVPFLRSPHFDPGAEAVVLGKAGDLEPEQAAALMGRLKELLPWRKGPFSICGENLDAEWRSELKWRRVAPHLPDLREAMVCDVGCNNGYTLFRLAALSPRLVLGLEPHAPYRLQYEALARLAPPLPVLNEAAGFEVLPAFPGCFDLILCMGIHYHHDEPLSLLKILFAALKPGGTLIFEGIGIDGEGTQAYFPEGPYARMKNCSFLPTRDCALAWMRRCRFREVELLDWSVCSEAEQRATEWMPFASFRDGMAVDSTRTIEGHPPPRRFVIKGRR
ncbi:MAG: hypothetical protein RL095_3178 [Verrucomicrobiota bacterium]